MKKQLLVGLMLLPLTACSTPAPDDKNSDENEVLENQENQNRYEQTIDFLDEAELMSVTEIVENNRAFYEAATPDYWADVDGSYPEHMKLYLHAWKTGTFKETEYKGQSLVLVKQDCEGPCNGYYFRYAVDESTDTWTLLADYSAETEGWTGGPQDASDALVSIPELDVPQELEAYENDSIVLLDRYSLLNADHFPEDPTLSSLEGMEEIKDFPDASFPVYYEFRGCLYAMTPDGLFARYSLMPKDFVGYDKEGNFDAGAITGKELTFKDTKGGSEKKTFSLSVGGCGLFSSCLATFSLTADEQARLQEVGTLNGRPVYLPESVGTRPDFTADQTLDSRLYDAFDNALTRKAYDLGQSPDDYKATSEQTIESFLAQNDTFLFKMDSGDYLLVNNAELAPMAECGKPVIYLYPQEDTVVNVQVGIEKFTKTIPAYGAKGWTVLARPDGFLTNLADALDYPYLFWEGTSSKAVDLGQTWTLAKDEVSTRLPEALKDMGLTDRETTDFMEFWGPRLDSLETPYVEFAFVGNEAMDEIAPLTLTPAADQVIRIFMYYRGTEEAGLEMPTFKPALRHGFTAVEWGGTLY